MKPTGDYIKLPMDSWPLKGRTGFASSLFMQLFWAEPVDSSEMVKFHALKTYPWGASEGISLTRYGWAPLLGYFLEYRGPPLTYHLEMSIVEFEVLKSSLYRRWNLTWSPEERREEEERILGIKLDVLTRLSRAFEPSRRTLEGADVPGFELRMEARDDGHIVYVCEERRS